MRPLFALNGAGVWLTYEVENVDDIQSRFASGTWKDKTLAAGDRSGGPAANLEVRGATGA